jgi:hypothetical protein
VAAELAIALAELTKPRGLLFEALEVRAEWLTLGEEVARLIGAPTLAARLAENVSLRSNKFPALYRCVRFSRRVGCRAV